jgi:hypothetical protein
MWLPPWPIKTIDAASGSGSFALKTYTSKQSTMPRVTAKVKADTNAQAKKTVKKQEKRQCQYMIEPKKRCKNDAFLPCWYCGTHRDLKK